jgi:hypothetical protein
MSSVHFFKFANDFRFHGWGASTGPGKENGGIPTPRRGMNAAVRMTDGQARRASGENRILTASLVGAAGRWVGPEGRVGKVDLVFRTTWTVV